MDHNVKEQLQNKGGCVITQDVPEAEFVVRKNFCDQGVQGGVQYLQIYQKEYLWWENVLLVFYDFLATNFFPLNVTQLSQVQSWSLLSQDRDNAYS